MLQEEVQSWIENCNEGTISVDDSEYEVIDFDVTAS
jgi:hypothetical protein